MSEFHFDEPKHGHRLPHDPFKGLSNGVGRMFPESLTGSMLRASVNSTSAPKPGSPALRADTPRSISPRRRPPRHKLNSASRPGAR